MSSEGDSPSPGPSSRRSYAAVVAGTTNIWEYQTEDEAEALEIALKRSWKEIEVSHHTWRKLSAALYPNNLKSLFAEL